MPWRAVRAGVASTGRAATAAWPTDVAFTDFAALIFGGALAVLLLIGVRSLCSGCRLAGGHISLRCCVSCQSDTDDAESLLPADSARSHSHTMQPRAAHTVQPHAEGAASAKPWDLRGRVALVTGGSKGLGRAIVEELLAHGCTVITCARDITPLVELSAAQPRCVVICADVSTAEGRSLLLSTVDRQFSAELDILVNNVGTNLRKASIDYTEAEYEALNATNQSSAFHLSRTPHPRPMSTHPSHLGAHASHPCMPLVLQACAMRRSSGGGAA